MLYITISAHVVYFDIGACRIITVSCVNMKTYPIKREDGSIHAFEIPSTWISMHAIKKILSSIPGVTSINRKLNSDDRLEFMYNNEAWVVNEPWGDNSRYWIGPINTDNHSISATSINSAFVEYQSLLKRLASSIAHAKNS